MEGIVEQTQYISIAKGDERYPYLYGANRLEDLFYYMEKFDIDYETTECNLGGKRFWLKCPECGQRKLSLFYVDGWFKCKECGHLLYEMQATSRKNRDFWKEYLYPSTTAFEIKHTRRPTYNGVWTKKYTRLVERFCEVSSTLTKEKAREYGFDI